MIARFRHNVVETLTEEEEIRVKVALRHRADVYVCGLMGEGDFPCWCIMQRWIATKDQRILVIVFALVDVEAAEVGQDVVGPGVEVPDDVHVHLDERDRLFVRNVEFRNLWTRVA